MRTMFCCPTCGKAPRLRQVELGGVHHYQYQCCLVRTQLVEEDPARAEKEWSLNPEVLAGAVESLMARVYALEHEVDSK